MKRFYCFTHTGILISLLQQNFKIKKCSRRRTFLSFALWTLSSSTRPAKFLSRPILVEIGWNWNLKFGFLGQYGQNTIFQTKWTKNTDDLKLDFVWFSSTVWRGQFALKVFAQNVWKENLTKYLLFSQVFSSRLFIWVPWGSFALFQYLFAWVYFISFL